MVDVAFTSIYLREDGKWVFTWDANPTDEFKIINNGFWVSNVTGDTYVYDLPGDYQDPPNLEIVPIADWADTEDNKPYVVLQWYGSTDAVVYVVELFANAVWNNQGTIKNEGQFLFKFTSAILGDATEPLFRVSAVNELMQTSTPVEIVKKVITCPLFRHSEISIGYDGSDLIIAQGV